MVLKLIQKTTSILLLLLVLGAIVFFIGYPYYSDIAIQAKEFNVERISHNTTLRFLTTLSAPNQAAIEEDITQSNSLEFIDPNELIKLQNEGEVLFNMEKEDTRLLVNSANILGDVVDGETAIEMERGFWHFPLSSRPGERGNTVIIAHRFLHLPPRTDTFFNLDKIRVGDKIVVEQKGGIYNYTVVESKVVEKNNRDVIAQTNDYRITLITCTPLWTSDQRLIVVAKLDKIYGNI
jgi:sortase A